MDFANHSCPNRFFEGVVSRRREEGAEQARRWERSADLETEPSVDAALPRKNTVSASEFIILYP